MPRIDGPSPIELSGTSLREFLRAGTSESHASLDAQVAARGYLRTLEGYRDFLQRSLRFQSGAEFALDAMGAQTWIPDWPQRRRTQLLLDDLRVLSSETDVQLPVTASVEVSESLSGKATRERVFGIAYVLEGSTLGAAYVLRELAPLGITATLGATFLAGGAIPKRRWPEFLSQLQSQDDPRFDRAAALEAARAAFSAASREFG